MELHESRSNAVVEARFKTGWAWQHFVASWRRNQGFSATEEYYSMRPEEKAELAKRGGFRDQPDLWLRGVEIGVEVKSKRQRFTSLGDFDFPSVMICNDNSLQKAIKSKIPRIAVVIVSQPTGAMFCVPWNPERWASRETRDGTFPYITWHAPKADAVPIDEFFLGT